MSDCHSERLSCLVPSIFTTSFAPFVVFEEKNSTLTLLPCSTIGPEGTLGDILEYQLP